MSPGFKVLSKILSGVCLLAVMFVVMILVIVNGHRNVFHIDWPVFDVI